MGWGDLQNFKEHKKVQIVALCDVDSNNLDKAAKVLEVNRETERLLGRDVLNQQRVVFELRDGHRADRF